MLRDLLKELRGYSYQFVGVHSTINELSSPNQTLAIYVFKCLDENHEDQSTVLNDFGLIQMLLERYGLDLVVATFPAYKHEMALFRNEEGNCYIICVYSGKGKIEIITIYYLRINQ